MGLTSQQHAADQHLHSILSNPLFNSRTNIRIPQQDGISKFIRESQVILERPMDYFEEQAAAGTATLEIARLCLEAQRNNTLSSAIRKTEEDTRLLKPGSIVLNWLWSSGFGESTILLTRWKLVRLLIHFLVIEGREKVIWRWLSKLETAHDISPNTEDSQHIIQSQKKILLKTIKSQMQFGVDLNIIIKSFVQRVREASTSSIPAKSVRSIVFKPTGRYLTGILAQRSMAGGFDPLSFDEFLEAVHLWAFTSTPYEAFLQLHHPVHPDETLAMTYIRGLSSDGIRMAAPKTRQFIARLCLDTTGMLLSKDSQVDAV